MEEENKQEIQPEVNQEVKNETKKVDLKNFDFKKYLPIIGVVAGVLLLIIILVSVLGGGPKKAVKKYIKAMNGNKAEKIVKSIDPIGSAAWSYNYNADKFDEDDYDDFIEDYEEYKEEYQENEDELENEMDYMIDSMDDMLDEIDDEYKSYKIKVEEFKKVEKLGKNLYQVKAKVSVKAKPKDKDDDEIDEAEVMTFIVYKNKLISGMGI